MVLTLSNECHVCDRRFSSYNAPATICPECHNSMTSYADDICKRLQKITGAMRNGHFIYAHNLIEDLEKLVKKKYAIKKKVRPNSYKIDGKWDKLLQEIH